MTEVIDAVFTPGQHVVIYGERGVGKTSLTTVLKDAFGSAQNTLSLRANCDGTDNYSTVWRKLFGEIGVSTMTPGFGFTPESQTTRVSATDLLPQEGRISPNDVRRAFEAIGRGGQQIVAFIDEFDRLEDPPSRALFADSIKTFSDQLTPATVVVVGVADNVDELISEHRSVERALVQIPMPRMSQEELAEIVDRGLQLVGMTIDPDARTRITRLSQGLPHYTHLMALTAARSVVADGLTHISLARVDLAIKQVVERAQESIISAYHKATFSTRDNLYKQVLLACALVPVDDLGYFPSGSVRDPLSVIMRRRYEIPAFAPHLNALSGPDRGPVLQKKGAQRNFKYRFLNPLLQPYVVMRGLADGMIDASTLDRFAGSPQAPGTLTR